MINMEPVLKRGFTFWDQALFPNDEYFERTRTVQAALRKAGLEALLIFSNSYENADASYVTGGAGGTVVVTMEGEPVIYTGGGGRELPFQRMLTWISDISAAGPNAGERVRQLLKERGVSSGAIGVAGGQTLSSEAYKRLTDSLSGYKLQDFDTEMRDIRARKRPREVTAVRMALRIATDAAAAAERAFGDGSTTTRAMLVAERSARLNKARDFRILANIDSDELRPFEGMSDAGQSPLLLWMGLTYSGYWADIALTTPAPANNQAARAVAAMTEAAKAGAKAGDVAKAGLARLPEAAREAALAYGLGSGIGLKLDDWPAITPEAEDLLVEGGLLSLRTLARDGEDVSFANAIVQVGANRGQRLEPL